MNANPPLRIIVGAGTVTQPGWISLQHCDLDIMDRTRWSWFFLPSSVDAILTEHTLEHLTVVQAFAAVQNFHRYLKPGGYVRCAVPDGLHPDPNYLNWVAPGSTGEQLLQNFRGGEPGHKTLWNYATLSQLFQDAGFAVVFREWFDEHGSFHRTEWSHEQGYVRRCRGCPWSNVLSFVVGAPYTSLLIDAIRI